MYLFSVVKMSKCVTAGELKIFAEYLKCDELDSRVRPLSYIVFFFISFSAKNKNVIAFQSSVGFLADLLLTIMMITMMILM